MQIHDTVPYELERELRAMGILIPTAQELAREEQLNQWENYEPYRGEGECPF